MWFFGEVFTDFETKKVEIKNKYEMFLYKCFIFLHNYKKNLVE